MYKEHLIEQELGTKGHPEKQKRHTVLEPCTGQDAITKHVKKRTASHFFLNSSLLCARCFA